MHPAQLTVEKLLEDCDIQRTRRGGPGGQHRNKVSSAVVITHRPTAISGQASERRSQHANRDVAIHRLRVNLAIGFRAESQAATENDEQDVARQSSELWRSRIRGGKVKVNPNHADFPALLAEAMDELPGCGFDVAAAAKWLGVSTSQLVKFLKLEPAALEHVNRERASRELGRMR